MLLADKIGEIRGQTLTALDASHDFYSHTKNVWRMTQRMVEQGREIAFRNLETGNVIDEKDIPVLAQRYVSGYLASATFQQFIAQFETYIFKFLKIWLNQYPHKYADRKISFQEIINSSSKDEIVEKVIDKNLKTLAYSQPAEWFNFIDDIVNLKSISSDQIAELSEIKASRDVLVHNNGVVNEIYVAKSGTQARFRPGEKLELPENYHRASWALIKELVQNISDEAIKKLTK